MLISLIVLIIAKLSISLRQKDGIRETSLR